MKICPTCQHTYPDDFVLCPRDGAPLTAQATDSEAQLAAGLSRRFRIVRRLGQGGMGTVFLAEQIGVGNRLVALKVLNRKLLDDPDFLLRFQNEAGSTGRIHHPNVVTIHEAAQGDDGMPYIAMEFLEGESLREVLKRRGALPVTEVAEILQQAARGLNAAHKLGIIHRDLKPDNLFLTHSDEGELVVKVVDFGIAKLRESAMHTQTGMVLGTPAYMSFEQASGMRSDVLDARSDIYSLGVVVYEMLSGRVPFQSDTPVGYLRKHLMEEPPPFRAVMPGISVPSRIEAVVMKALNKDRNQRYGSVLEFAQEFSQADGTQVAAQPVAQRETVKIQPQTTVTPVPRARHHLWKKVELGLAGLCVLGVLGGGGYYAWTRYETWREVTRTCKEWEGTHPVGSPLDLDVGTLERQFVWDPPRGCSGPLEDAYRKREIAWREEQRKNGAVTDYAVQLCVDQEVAPGEPGNVFDQVSCMERIYEPLPDDSTAITERYLKGASQQVRDCVAKSTPAGSIATLLEQREQCTKNPNNPVVLNFSKAVPIQSGSALKPAQKQVETPPAAAVSAGQKPRTFDNDDFSRYGVVSKVNPKDGLKYVWIPPGTFMMGCSPDDNECQDNEKPPHQVTLTKGYWLGQTPVTVGAYKRFAGATGRKMPPEPDFNHEHNMPMVYVDWDDAHDYCTWVGGRLPTEAEWEYAARAGSTASRYGPINDVAWYFKNSGDQPHPVGEKRANGFGLYDMLGNVAELANDWFGDYQRSPSQDPAGPASGSGRIQRGEPWGGLPKFVRVSHRYSLQPDYRLANVGFRCVGEVFAP